MIKVKNVPTKVEDDKISVIRPAVFKQSSKAAISSRGDSTVFRPKDLLQVFEIWLENTKKLDLLTSY